MIRHDAHAMVAGMLCVVGFWPAPGSAQTKTWDDSVAAANEAYQQGRYTEAEKLFEAALKEAEGFGPQDPRLATSLNSPAVLYYAQGKYTEAEPLVARALVIREKALGLDHQDVATSLNDLGGSTML